MVRKVLKGILFVGIFIVLLLMTSYIVSPKNNDKKSGMLQATAYGILAEKENTIDTLIIGDSESYSSLSPMQLWDEHGYTSYVCGTPAQQLCQSYDMLEKVLKTQKPKVVILEANAIYRPVSAIDYLFFKSQEWLPVLKYHDRWKHLNANDFHEPINYTWTHEFKGFRYNRDIKASRPYSYMTKPKKQRQIADMNLYFLNKIHQTCLDHDIEFILLSVPSIKNWNYDKHDGIERYAKEKGIAYIDMNLEVTNIGIDWLKDTRDQGDHLNYTGAYKATKYLGNYLQTLSILPNHKNDRNYDDWNINLRKYKKMIIKSGS